MTMFVYLQQQNKPVLRKDCSYWSRHSSEHILPAVAAADIPGAASRVATGAAAAPGTAAAAATAAAPRSLRDVVC